MTHYSTSSLYHQISKRSAHCRNYTSHRGAVICITEGESSYIYIRHQTSKACFRRSLLWASEIYYGVMRHEWSLNKVAVNE